MQPSDGGEREGVHSGEVEGILLYIARFGIAYYMGKINKTGPYKASAPPWSSQYGKPWDLSNYATKKELEHATGIDASDLVAKKDFIALKAEVDTLNINKLVNVSTSLNDLKTKVHDLEVSKLKTVPADLKKLSDVIDNEVVKTQNSTYWKQK